MPKQDWNINTAPAAAGDVYGLAFTNSQRLTYALEAPMTAFGVAVVQGAKSDTVKAGHVAGKILGVTMRQNVTESATRPGDGTVGLKAGTPMAVMLDGPIQILLQTAITDANIGISATGQFGGVDGSYTAATNVVALKYPAAAGDVIPVMVSYAPVK